MSDKVNEAIIRLSETVPKLEKNTNNLTKALSDFAVNCAGHRGDLKKDIAVINTKLETQESNLNNLKEEHEACKTSVINKLLNNKNAKNVIKNGTSEIKIKQQGKFESILDHAVTKLFGKLVSLLMLILFFWIMNMVSNVTGMVNDPYFKEMIKSYKSEFVGPVKP